MIENILGGLLTNLIWLGAGALVTFLFFLRRRSQLLASGVRLVKSGVSEFFPNRDSYTRDRKLSLEAYLETTKIELHYIGHWMAVSVDQRHTLDSVKKILTKGKTVQLVLLDKNLPQDMQLAYARFFGKTHVDFQAQLESGWHEIRTWREGLGEEEKRRLTLKSHKEMICHSAFVFDRGHEDGKILIDQKLWGLDRKNSFGFELKADDGKSSFQDSLFKRYSKSLGDLVNSSMIISL